MPRSDKGKIATVWMVLIAFGVIGTVGSIIVVVLGVKTFRENFSPGHAAKVAREIVDLPDPLPDGWEYGTGLDVGSTKVVNVIKKSGASHPMVQFTELAVHRHNSAKDMPSKFTMPSTAGMKFESDAQGEEDIGGKRAYYVRGRFTIIGRSSAVEIADIDLPGGRIMQIQSTEQGQSTFDSALVKPLLDSVKGFH